MPEIREDDKDLKLKGGDGWKGLIMRPRGANIAAVIGSTIETPQPSTTRAHTIFISGASIFSCRLTSAVSKIASILKRVLSLEPSDIKDSPSKSAGVIMLVSHKR